MTETYDDRPLRFALPGLEARGRCVRLGPVLDQILSAHAYPPPVEALLAEALTLTALLGLLLKDASGQVTIQARTDEGAVSLLVCDYRTGALRGYAEYDAPQIAALPTDPSLFALFGRGYLTITFDQPVPETRHASGQDSGGRRGGRYQGIVPLEGARLAEALEYYFVQSEQVPTVLRVATGRDPAGPVAGGLLLQHLPEGEEGRERLHVRLDHPHWETALALGATLTGEELTDRALSLETLLWRLFHDEGEIRVEAEAPLSRGCRCSAKHIRDVIGRFPASERTEMADDAGVIGVDCAFCAKTFAMSLASFGSDENASDANREDTSQNIAATQR